ncbi:MAG TPA: FAD/NAD(P)-binding protein [Ramlibacter sp.]|nr:FAD/NAD(P)-binding protein [Ramlibacter sp.]
MPSSPSNKQVVIVGGGFSGAATAIHLSRLARQPLDIRIVEPREALGQGIAHSATEPDLRLNGPANIHAPYPDALGDFGEWLARTGELQADPAATAASGLVFARRGTFGRYMASELERHARSNPSGSTIDHIQRHAVAARPTRAGVVVELADKRRLTADACILALGWNEVATPRELSAITGEPGWFGNPWRTDRFDAVDRHARVLLVGTGLTASDTFAVLAARGHQGPVFALSRKGLRPASQNPHRSARPIWDRVTETDPAILRQAPHPLPMREAIAMARRVMAQVDPATSSWHVPFDEFRDAGWLLWNQWTVAEQRQYLRHVKGWYDAFRFRNPPQTEAIVQAGLERGQLRFGAGRMRSARQQDGALAVDYESRQDAAPSTLVADAIINCTGPHPRPSSSGNPFWRALIAEGVARDAPCGAGIDVDLAGRLVDREGRVHEKLFAVGPPTVGRFAESIAVPYIVRGILEICRHVNGGR